MSGKVPEKVRLQPFVDKAVADRLDQLGAEMGWTRNQAAEWLLECATSDVEWLGNKAVAKIAGALKRAVRGRASGKPEAEGGVK
jgi:hypothetical protein